MECSTDILTALKDLVERSTNGIVKASALTDDSNLVEECGFDSISLVEFFLDVEQEFDLQSRAVDADEKLPSTIGGLAQWIHKRLALQPGRQS